MTPSLDLMLATIERALTGSILPGAANASAKEEASLAILFTRWLRDVIDHTADAERASYRDCRALLVEAATELVSTSPEYGPREVLRQCQFVMLGEAETLPEIREEARKVKALLGDLLAALREAGDDDNARTLRAKLYELGGREIEREQAFGRATGLDPGSPSIPTLTDVLRRQAEPTEEPR